MLPWILVALGGAAIYNALKKDDDSSSNDYNEDYDEYYDSIDSGANRQQYIQDFYDKMWHSYRAKLNLKKNRFSFAGSHKLDNLQQAIDKRNNEIQELENRLRSISQISL